MANSRKSKTSQIVNLLFEMWILEQRMLTGQEMTITYLIIVTKQQKSDVPMLVTVIVSVPWNNVFYSTISKISKKEFVICQGGYRSSRS